MSKTVALVFLFLSVLVNGIANFLLKDVAVGTSSNFFLNKSFWISVSMLSVGFFLYVISLKKIEVSIAYPTAASLTTVFIGILSFIYLKEKLNIRQIIGVGIILGGIWFVVM